MSYKYPPLNYIKSTTKLNGNYSGKLFNFINTALFASTLLIDYFNSPIVYFIFPFKKNLDFKA